MLSLEIAKKGFGNSVHKRQLLIIDGKAVKC